AGCRSTEEEYWQQKYQYDLLEQQAERAERQRQFNLQQEGRNNAAILERFGQYVPRTPPQGTGQAAQAMSARSQIMDEVVKAQQDRAKLQAQVAEQQFSADPNNFVPVTAPRPGPVNPEATPYPNVYGATQMIPGAQIPGRRAYYPNEVTPAPGAERYNPRPSYIRGPAFGMSADQSAANTMRGNAAFGIHVDRGNAVGPRAAAGGRMFESALSTPAGAA